MVCTHFYIRVMLLLYTLFSRCGNTVIVPHISNCEGLLLVCTHFSVTIKYGCKCVHSLKGVRGVIVYATVVCGVVGALLSLLSYTPSCRNWGRGVVCLCTHQVIT